VRWVLYLSTLLATCAWADDTTDREAIERLIAALNNHSKPLSDLFTADAPESEQSVLSAHEEPLSEITSPRITIRSIRLITSQVALVECTNTQYGSMIMARTTSMLLVMKKDGAQWRIASVRALRDSPSIAKPSLDH
jgi:hypothetical protein